MNPPSAIGAALLTGLTDEWDDAHRIAWRAGVSTPTPGQPLAALVRRGLAESSVLDGYAVYRRAPRPGARPGPLWVCWCRCSRRIRSLSGSGAWWR